MIIQQLYWEAMLCYHYVISQGQLYGSIAITRAYLFLIIGLYLNQNSRVESIWSLWRRHQPPASKISMRNESGLFPGPFPLSCVNFLPHHFLSLSLCRPPLAPSVRYSTQRLHLNPLQESRFLLSNQKNWCAAPERHHKLLSVNTEHVSFSTLGVVRAHFSSTKWQKSKHKF